MDKQVLINWLEKQASNARIDQTKAERVKVKDKYAAQAEVYEYIKSLIEHDKLV